MKSLNRWFAVTVAASVAFVTGCEPAEPEVRVVDATAIEHGAALFQDPTVAGSDFNSYTCATCHATTGAAADEILPGAPLAGAVKRPSYWGGQERNLLRAVNHCLYFFMLKDDAWTTDDVEARAVYAFLESLPGDVSSQQPAPFTVAVTFSDPPQGDATRGEAVFDRACVSCHGEAFTGEGRLVPRASVLPGEWLDAHPLDKYTPLDRRLVFTEKVRHGTFLGYGGQMPPFSLDLLTDQQIGDLLAYLGVP